MSTLRDALQASSISIDEQISAAAVKRLAENTAGAVKELRESYSDFFQVMHDKVLNAPGMNASDDAAPAIFRNSGVPFEPWHAVSPRWFEQKERAKAVGSFRALNFYHGLTEALLKGIPAKRKKNKKLRRKGNLSLDQFVQALALGRSTVVEDFFGPITVKYTVERPDKGKVQLKELGEAISVLRQWSAHPVRFASSLDGTIIRTTITAFPKLTAGMTEKSLITYMINHSEYEEQWIKFSGWGHNRPVILPLINWYMKAQFSRLLEERFG